MRESPEAEGDQGRDDKRDDHDWNHEQRHLAPCLYDCSIVHDF